MLKLVRRIYQSADYHVVVYPDLHPGRAGRAVVRPVGFTKTYAMAGAALLARSELFLILMVTGFVAKFRRESSNPLNRFLIRVHHPLLLKVLHWPKTTLLVTALSVLNGSGRLIKLAGNFYRRLMKATCWDAIDAAWDFRSRGGEARRKNRQANYERT
ncbi:hypothetical protein ACLK19_03905 [Escherichia coli]